MIVGELVYHRYIGQHADQGMMRTSWWST